MSTARRDLSVSHAVLGGGLAGAICVAAAVAAALWSFDVPAPPDPDREVWSVQVPLEAPRQPARQTAAGRTGWLRRLVPLRLSWNGALPRIEGLAQRPDAPARHAAVEPAAVAPVGVAEVRVAGTGDVVSAEAPAAAAVREQVRVHTRREVSAEAAVRAAVERHEDRVHAAFERRRAHVPGLSGRVEVSLLLRDGRAVETAVVHNTTGDRQLGEDIAGVLSRLRYPEATGEATRAFVFR